MSHTSDNVRRSGFVCLRQQADHRLHEILLNHFHVNMITLLEFLQNRSDVPAELIKRAEASKSFFTVHCRAPPDKWEQLYSNGVDHIGSFLGDVYWPLLLKGFPPLCGNSVPKAETKAYTSVYGLKVAKFVSDFAVLEDLIIKSATNVRGDYPPVWESALHHDYVISSGASVVLLHRCLREVGETFFNLNSFYDGQTFFTTSLWKQHKYGDERTSILQIVGLWNSKTWWDKRGVVNHGDGVCLLKDEGYNVDQIEELVDYLADLRNCKNVRFPFGILTTYEKWRIVWFQDSDIAAKETSTERYEELCEANRDVFCISGSVKVCMSRIYERSEVELIYALGSVIFKVINSPAPMSQGFLDPRRAYVCMSGITATYQQLPKELTSFSYEPPDLTCNELFVLVNYRRGSDGNVALCCSVEGNLCVVKFMTNKRDAREEARIWNRIWGTECHVQFIMEHWALVMPFCFSIREPRGQFLGLHGWLSQSNNHSCWNGDEFKDDEVRDVADLDMEQFLAFNKNPVKAAEIALEKLFKKKIRHGSIKWDHVALLPKKLKSQNKFRMVPVLLDMTKFTKTNMSVESEMQCALLRLNKQT